MRFKLLLALLVLPWQFSFDALQKLTTPVVVIESEEAPAPLILPHIIDINGHSWSIIEVSRIRQCHCIGYTSTEAKTILLEAAMPLRKQQAVLLHELSHASLVEFGKDIDHQNLPWTESTHDAIEALAPALADTLRRNPHLLVYFSDNGEVVQSPTPEE